MIYELRTYTFRPGKIGDWLELVPQIRAVRPDADNCCGYWTAEFGRLKRGWHLWCYDSLNERERLRRILQRSKAFGSCTRRFAHCCSAKTSAS